MKAGRYAIGLEAEPFILQDSKIIPWARLVATDLPAELRQLLCDAIRTKDHEPFCTALPLLAAAVPDLCLPAGIPLPRRLPSPVSPRNFLCVGLNYSDHAAESSASLPSEPLLFAKTSNALTGHGCPIQLPPGSSQVDYEAELAIVIGRQCHAISTGHAFEYIAGYCCANDISARDFQFRDGQWFRGKSADTFGPLGPWMVTPDEVGDAQALEIQLRLNGNLMQHSNTRRMIFPIPRLIEHISQIITLQPGDVILTGTPPGVGFARKPPVFLCSGDHVEVEIQAIGILSNSIA